MPFEIVPTPHLPPYKCTVCGCSESGNHVFLPAVRTWDGHFPFICGKCVEEMAGAMGITKPEVVTNTVEVVRDPNEAEILEVLERRYARLHHALTKGADVVPVAQDHVPSATKQADKQDAADDDGKVLTCVCGQEFTGKTAAAKLGSHKRTCEAAKAAVGDA